MTELYFMRHGQRIDHVLQEDRGAKPIYPDFKPYDPSLAISAVGQISSTAVDIINTTKAFDSEEPAKKNVFIHFSPYLRCCQSADLLISDLKPLLESKFPQYKVRFQLLGDFALSEWIHDKMKNKPPFYDSNDAYQMYTPNIRLLKNRSCCSNFRPTNTLGHWNGYDLSYKDYQNNCKEYFKKLLATYDKPTHINNKDIIIVISHGYFINNLLSYFVTHPIFDEIPEAKINFAEKKDGQWVLVKDALNMFNFDEIDKSLNLESDIVYYKTNFIKRDELNQNNNNLTIKKEDKPRPSFKIYQTSESYAVEMARATSKNKDDKAEIKTTKDNFKNSQILNNPICPAAKDWTPQRIRKFQIRNEFKLKVINSEAFKPDFDITRPPSRPFSPEVSPCSEPTRNNSVIDLSKLVETDDNYKPMKLRYSTASDIPMEKLNQKVNSQVNLAQYQRSYPSSNNSSISDFPKFVSNHPKRTLSNPSYFPPQGLNSPKLSSTLSDDSIDQMDDESIDSNDLNIIKEDKKFNLSSSPVPTNALLTRSKSSKYKQELALNGGSSILALYQKQQQQQLNKQNSNKSGASDDEEDKFTLSFQNKPKPKPKKSSSKKPEEVQKDASPQQRKNSIKFIPSLGYDPVDREANSTPVGMYTRPPIPTRTSSSMFYNLNSDSDSNSDSPISSDDEEEIRKKDDYMWFGENRK